MKKWLSIMLLLILLPRALAEADFVSGSDESASQSVDAYVGEEDFTFGDDGVVAQEETYIENPVYDAASDASCYLNCPDVYDLKNVVKASERVYPGALVWPLKGRTPPVRYHSHVGWRDAARIYRSQGGTWASWLHHGVDISGVTTSQVVVAAASGIAYAGEQRGNGRYVVIDHGNGFYTKYQHLSRFAGEIFDGCREIPVEAGDPIGYVGNTGGDYPVHFHFEIAWSPDGAGSDDTAYHEQTHNRTIRAYSFPQQAIVKLHWPDTWELCSAEYQTFVTDPAELIDETTPED